MENNKNNTNVLNQPEIPVLAMTHVTASTSDYDDYSYDDDSDEDNDEADEDNDNNALSTPEQQLVQVLQKHETEVSFYRRFVSCMCIMLIFWFVMLYFVSHHDYGIVIAGFVILGLWFIYVLACIFGNLYLRFQKQERDSDSHSHPQREREREQGEPRFSTEDAKLTAPCSMDPLHPEDDDNNPFPYDFEETLEQIQKCQQPISSSTGIVGPTNGTYTAIYTAIVFNKMIRTEGKLHLEFFPITTNNTNGWTIQGESVFGAKNSLPIQEGFVNTKGEMFWKTNSTMHRGILDFRSSCMFDGEFCSVNPLKGQQQNQQRGRIVRIELIKANFYSSFSSSSNSYSNTRPATTNNNSDLEMVTFSSN